MISLPSVGAKVSGVALNPNATKARITFNDGCVIIVSTEGSSSVAKVKTEAVEVPKKKIVKKKTSTPKNIVNVKLYDNGSQTMTESGKKYVESAVARSKNRIARLAEEAMTPSDKVSATASEGPVNI